MNQHVDEESAVLDIESQAPQPIAPDPLWHKDAVIYQLHVRAFFDSNEDGHGDFAGLTSQTRLHQGAWRQPRSGYSPFYPSPLKDDGYDVADYH